jgi:glutathione synthase
MRIALQIDPPASLDPGSDTSLLLGREAQRRGYTLSFYTPDTVTLHQDGKVSAFTHALTLHESSPFFSYAEGQTQLLSDFDVILLRQNPPFDMAYITNTHALEMLPPSTKVVNNPAAIRNHPEKLFPLKFPEFLPETLITRHEEDIRSFAKTHREIVLKPLYGFGGQGIFKINAAHENLGAILELLLQSTVEPIVVQRFLPEVLDAEKRIILINGKIEAAFQRQPKAGEIRSNMRVGGTPVETTLTTKEKAIAEQVGAYCASHGLLLAGLDVIGGYLNEINITSPTGLIAAKTLYGSTPEKSFWDAVTKQ